MDVRRHMTSGRLSEMFGKSQVKDDEFLRTLGWDRVAQKEYDTTLSASTKKYLQAYAKGVNAYLQGKDGKDISLSTRPLASPTTTSPRSGPRSTPSRGSRRWPGTCAATCRTRSTAR
ncbi:penicillin acylase family protein [Streptomyces sp. L7]